MYDTSRIFLKVLISDQNIDSAEGGNRSQEGGEEGGRVDGRVGALVSLAYSKI